MGNIRENKTLRRWTDLATTAYQYAVCATGLGLIGTVAYLVIANPLPRENEYPRNKYSRSWESHSGLETLTDIDHDGSWDLLDWEARGQPRKLYFKKGFGSPQSVDAEIHIVDSSYFDLYNKYYSVYGGEHD